MIAPLFFFLKARSTDFKLLFSSTTDYKYLRLLLGLNHVFIYTFIFNKFTKIIKEVFISKQSLKSFCLYSSSWIPHYIWYLDL